MNGAPVATVPAGGLDQIPDGGAPYFAGGLVVVDNLGTPVLDFEMTQRENSNSTFTLSFLNRSSNPITINAITPAFEVAAGVFSRKFPRHCPSQHKPAGNDSLPSDGCRFFRRVSRHPLQRDADPDLPVSDDDDRDTAGTTRRTQARSSSADFRRSCRPNRLPSNSP
jgi:hypothetical protein